jgi:hypothetical protein
MTKAISPLRQRMIDDMKIRNMSPNTQKAYIRAVQNFSRHFGQPPDRLTFEHVRQYQLHLSTDRGRGHEGGGVSYRSARQAPDWWPADLGTPTSVGAQNDLRYAVFPRRLAIKDGDHVEIYDTGNHRIFGVAQAQSSDRTLTFTSQDGLVRVGDLPKVKSAILTIYP